MLFLAVMSVFIWGRFLLMLQLTKSFGPMLRIVIVMVSDVLKFLAIWIVILVCLASVSNLLFGDITGYAKFFQTLQLMFGTGLGNYDLGAFENSQFDKLVGEIFIVIAVLINSVVLLNFIIAILADTYSKLSVQSLGIYYDGIIARIPLYEDDMRYGGLIVAAPPLNLLAVVMIPFYLFIKDDRRLRQVNDAYTKFSFLPLALFLTLIFMVLNLVSLPFAFIVAIMKKV